MFSLILLSITAGFCIGYWAALYNYQSMNTEKSNTDDYLEKVIMKTEMFNKGIQTDKVDKIDCVDLKDFYVVN